MRALRPIFVLLTTISLLPAADDLQTVFNKIDQGAAGFKGLTADVHRVTHMDLIKEEDTENGDLALKRPKPHDLRMRIDFFEPGSAPNTTPRVTKQIQFAGSKVEVFYPKNLTDEEYDLGSHKGMVEQFLALGFGSTSQDLRKDYNIRYLGQETISGQPTSRIELIPKSPDMAETFPKIELWISNATGMAMQQKLFEKGGKDFQLFTYSNMKLRPDLSDAAVKVAIPKDAHHQKQPLK